jgi:PAS domain S-box-containing protein
MRGDMKQKKGGKKLSYKGKPGSNDVSAYNKMKTKNIKSTHISSSKNKVQKQITNNADNNENESRYKDLVENSNCIILDMDLHGSITFINKFGMDFFGYKKDEILLHNIFGTIVPKIDSGGKDLQKLMDDIIRDPDNYYSSENENLQKNGDHVWIAWTNRGFYDDKGALTGVHSFGIDRTRQKKYEEELAEYRDKLKEMVKFRTAELDKINDDLKNEILIRKQINDALLSSEEKFRTLSEQSVVGAIILQDNIIKYANNGFVAMSGYSRDELYSMKSGEFGLLLHENDRDFVVKQAVKKQAGGSSVDDSYQVRAIAKNGSIKWVNLNGKSIIYEGRTADFINVVDITNIKETEDALLISEQKFRNIFEEAPEGIFQSTIEGRFISVNVRLAAMFGYDNPEQMINEIKTIRTQLFIDSSQRDEIVACAIKERTYVQREIMYRHRNGTLMFCNLYMRAVRNDSDEVMFLEGFVDDISSRKKAEAELELYRGHLEELVKQRTAELVVATERAESADRLKSAFLATMSHELRTPLNSIIGFTGILLQGLAGELNDEQKKQLDMVRTSAEHLLAMINDVLDISKIEAGQLQLVINEFELNSIIDKVIHIVGPLAEKKGLILEFIRKSDNIIIKCDQRRLEQVILNLLSNAVKFTNSGSVRVDCTYDDGFIIINVSDSGIGIKPEDIDNLFKPFKQLDSGLNRQNEGTGLGLSICKKIVELMGGNITVKSDLGHGSVFSFRIPLKN